MKRLHQLAGAAAIAVVACSSVVVLARPDSAPAASAQSAPQTWEVQVGADAKADGVTANAFAPDMLTIRAGDSVVFRTATEMVPHSVSFAAGKPGPLDILPGPNAGELMMGPAFFPIGVTGGSATFTGAEPINSGVGEGDVAEPFRVTFPKAGIFTYTCPLHPGMSGTIQVVGDGASLPETPEQAKSRGQATLTEVLANGKTVASRVQSASASTGGGSVKTVALGVSHGGGGSALRFLPGDVTVRRGDVVAWSLADPFEIHTATFVPSGEKEPEFIDVRPQPSGPPQLVIPATIAGPSQGDFTGRSFFNSGILTPGNSFAARIDAPAGKYTFVCVVHPEMKGSITVTE